jgi:hypothetical protein
VYNLHQPHVESTPKGLTIEGHTKEGQTDRQTNPHSKYVNCKSNASQSSVILNTDNQSEKPQSQSDQSSIDLDISNLNWPKDLSQNVMTALAKRPDDQARQEVLELVAKK